MFILVCYDVETLTKEGKRRLRKVAKLCESHGQRVQHSVFECKMDKSLYLTFENKIVSIIDTKSDSLRIYILDEDSIRKIKNFGIASVIDYEQPLVL
ncbi:MAG TPA: CRISPR-associated endonuclease Cas2 [Leptospiraceae bacterium]|nr:CRISPR-associated endonuclease Cas2 [Leptospiraceae bacterium]HMW08685.1 CRISPR-associated endonuclease Cas2 [Leptospiraceae bacterium]HMX34938.1 CRISPR-associated endonuclease Cas2 [Leptospiraceae bacterium]HMY34398.1 CRISPR-associated endonuclease Cas2 [Leptospiraceae bacterium]HMZ67203.1 CRISPR-associated endonuclease Cas2 [Leptospiraceae bacterium]